MLHTDGRETIIQHWS